jgi:hypothetical protein
VHSKAFIGGGAWTDTTLPRLLVDGELSAAMRDKSRRELVTSVLRPPGRKENLQWIMENLPYFAYLLTLILEQHHVAGLIPAGQGRALAVRGPGKSKDLARLEICQLPRRTAINGLAPQV